jgi:hypothetical protein
MPRVGTPIVGYEAPRPAEESRIQCEFHQDGVTLSIARPGWKRLLACTAVPMLFVAILLCVAGLGAYVFVSHWGRLSENVDLVWMAFLGVPAGLFFIPYAGMLVWQNIGVVTCVEIRGERFTWNRVNVWGVREYRWDMKWFRSADVRDGTLVINFSDRIVLLAFARFKEWELWQARHCLYRGIDRARGIPDDPDDDEFDFDGV